MPRFIKLTLSALVLVALAAGDRAYLARESAQPGSAQRESGAGPGNVAPGTLGDALGFLLPCASDPS